MKHCTQEFSKSPRPAHTTTLKANWQTNSDQNAEASASSSQFASTEKLVKTKRAGQCLLNIKSEKSKTEDAENDQASTGENCNLREVDIA